MPTTRLSNRSRGSENWRSIGARAGKSHKTGPRGSIQTAIKKSPELEITQDFLCSRGTHQGSGSEQRKEKRAGQSSRNRADAKRMPILYAIYVTTNMGAHVRAGLPEMTVSFFSKLSYSEPPRRDARDVHTRGEIDRMRARRTRFTKIRAAYRPEFTSCCRGAPKRAIRRGTHFPNTIRRVHQHRINLFAGHSIRYSKSPSRNAWKTLNMNRATR